MLNFKGALWNFTQILNPYIAKLNAYMSTGFDTQHVNDCHSCSRLDHLVWWGSWGSFIGMHDCLFPVTADAKPLWCEFTYKYTSSLSSKTHVGLGMSRALYSAFFARVPYKSETGNAIFLTFIHIQLATVSRSRRVHRNINVVRFSNGSSPLLEISTTVARNINGPLIKISTV